MEPSNIRASSKMEEFLKKSISVTDQNERQKQYQQLIFEAKIYDLSAFDKMKLLYRVGKDLKDNEIIFFLGNHFPVEKKLVEKALYFFILFLDEIVENNYIMVYFHNGLSGMDKQKLNFLTETFKVLPMKYFRNLTQLYTVALPWALKFDLELGMSFSTKYLKKMVINLPSNEELAKLEFYQPNFCKYLPESDIDTSKELFKQQVFGKHLSDYALSDNGVPYIIMATTLYFESDETRVQIEGIFRRVSAASDVQKLISHLEMGDYDYVFTIKETLVLSDFLKKFFANLPDPLFPYYIYEELLKFQTIQESDKLKFLKETFKEIPKLNSKVIAHMLKFFKFVTLFEKNNKMTAKNIGICFVPCFLRRDPENKEPKVLNTMVLNSVILSHCLEVMILNVEEIFPDDLDSFVLQKIIKKKTFIVQELKNYDANDLINQVFLKNKK